MDVERVALHRRNGVRVVAVLGLTGAALWLAGPVHRTDETAKAALAVTGAVPHGRLPQGLPAQAPGRGTGGVSGGAGGGSMGGAVGGGAPVAGGIMVDPAAPPLNGAPRLTGVAPSADAKDATRVVKSAEIALAVRKGEVPTTLTRVGDAAAAAGGYVYSSQSQEFGAAPSGTVTLRVPVKEFDHLVSTIRGFRGHVRSSQLSGQDVTAEYADLQAQLSSLKAARARFLDILATAKTVGDVLSIQQRVDDVSGQIDRIEGQRRVLASQSDLATLTVTVNEADDPVLGPARGNGIATAFRDARDGFVSGLDGLIARSGRALLILLVLAALVAVVRLCWRAASHRLA